MRLLIDMLKIILITMVVFKAYSCHSQNDFSIEVGAGPTLADSKTFFSYTIQGNVNYLWGLSDVVNLGLETGAIVFLGEGSNKDGSKGWFSSIPDVFILLAVASSFNISQHVYAGIDIGYALNVNYFGDNDGGFLNNNNGGFYICPSIAYRVKEKLAFVLSYSSISEENYNSASLNLGLNFRF